MENMYREFEWNNILIALDYQHKKWGVIDHIDIRTIDPPCAPLPITETGYLSHYFQPGLLEEFGNNPVNYIREILEYQAQNPEWQRQQDAARQYSLF